MLNIPSHCSDAAYIAGIDPGSNTLGIAFLEVDTRTGAILSVDSKTLFGAKNGKGTWTTEVHGERWGRIVSHRERIFEEFMRYQPVEVGCEAPFISPKHPQAGLALTEVIATIRYALMDYDPWKTLDLIDPPTVKLGIGVKGSTGGDSGKLLMQQAIMRLGLRNVSELSFEEMDDHSIDAIAVAIWKYKRIMGLL